MKTSTLRHLVQSLTDVRHYHLATALLETDPDRQSRERDKAFRVEVVLDAIRAELAIRETHSVRTPDDVQQANDRLERVLAAFLEFSDADERPRPAAGQPVAVAPAASRAECAIETSRMGGGAPHHSRAGQSPTGNSRTNRGRVDR